MNRSTGSKSMGPVFLLAGGGRTGSTLLQRLIISTRQVLVWGEHGGILLPQMRKLLNQTHSWIESANGYRMLDEFKIDAHNAWVPNLNPEPTSLRSAGRAFIEQYLGASARKMGYTRWGFKEIRYGTEDVRMLQTLFPRASFVFLVRNPVSCLRSIKATHWYAGDHGASPAAFLNEWVRISGSLAGVYPECQRACLLRYEDAISNPEATVRAIAKTIEVPFAAFDLSVFDRQLRGEASSPAALDTADWQALQNPDVLSVAGKLGYGSLEQFR
jgi:hypothetical protein